MEPEVVLDMSALDQELSAGARAEVTTLLGQVLGEDPQDTLRHLGLFLDNVKAEKLRWACAVFSYDQAAADAAAAEIRDLSALVAICVDRLTAPHRT